MANKKKYDRVIKRRNTIRYDEESVKMFEEREKEEQEKEEKEKEELDIRKKTSVKL